MVKKVTKERAAITEKQQHYSRHFYDVLWFVHSHSAEYPTKIIVPSNATSNAYHWTWFQLMPKRVNSPVCKFKIPLAVYC